MKEIIKNGIELKDGEMKIVHIDNHDLLLVKRGHDFYLTGAHCPHYGAPLDKGILNGDRIVCPWHHSCFNIKTGALEEPPSLHSLNKADIEVQGKDLVVRIPEQFSENILPKMVQQDILQDSRNFIIIGAGAAALSAAQILRERGYKGNIKMITSETDAPYDRPNLSKAYLSGKAPDDWMPLHTSKFYSTYGIDIMFNKTVKDINRVDKHVVLDSGEELDYDKLLIATGAVPVKPAIPGINLENIFTLRSYESCKKIINAAEKAVNIAVLGSSFIATETAFHVSERTGRKAHLLIHGKVPFEKSFGKEIGALFLRKYQQYGTKVYTDAEVVEFRGDEKVKSILLKSGHVIEADMVILGTGVVPATDFLQDFDLLSDKSIEVDKNFKTFDSIYAAGDIATYPDWRTQKPIRIEHWRTAQQQGRVAGMNMLGIAAEYTGVPFFWTTQAGINLRYIGYAHDWDEIIYDGDVDSEKFIAYYIKDNLIMAAAGIKRDKDMAALSELMRTNELPSADELKRKQFIPNEKFSKGIYA